MIEKTISALADQIRGVSYNKRDLHDKLDENSIILLRANNIVEGKLNFRDVVYVDKNVVSADQYLKDGDILISASSGSKKMVGKAASFHSKDKCTFGAFCKVVRPHDNIKEFLRIYFQSATYRREISHLALGANINNIRNEHINSLQVRVPDYRTRLQIIKVINTLQKIRDVRKQELKKLDELIKARFVEMFGDPVLNSKKYPEKALANYINFITSGSRGWSKYLTPKGKAWFLTIKNVKNSHIAINNIQSVEPPDSKEAQRTKVKEGDLLISITADLGRTGVVSSDIASHGTYINQHLTCIRLDTEFINPVYASYFLESVAGKRQFNSKNQNGVKAGLNFDAIKSLKIIIPPIKKQNSFVSFVRQVDKSKVAVQKSLEETQKLYDSLMQEYFG
ncbi:restriction endonuclease subunit S [Limosilactobacillus reuteri]|uniref:restriction endonuclease subunit S n=3 Tax=Limosilactobacillus reuteri TaxID=1598 RepID=UPI00254DDF0D|nr:restriction endonuclease subunit S [Limosilactobacillus reuteri]MDK8116204.1 restriction endonuclease subunit S [Limosilactobacillus reuteri]